MNQELVIETKGSPENPAVLCLHGFMGAARNLRRITEELARNGYFAISYDQRGHGRSPWAEHYDLDLYSNDVFHVMNKFNLDKTHILGHSMGGRVALQACGKAENKFFSLMLLDVGPMVSEEARMDLKKLIDPLPEEFPDFASAEKALAQQSPAMAQFLLTNIKRPSHDMPSTKTTWNCDLKGLKELLNKAIQLDQTETLRKLKLPILALRGENSSHFSASEMKNLHELNPRIQTGLVKNAGHWVHADNLSDTTKQVLAFLK